MSASKTLSSRAFTKFLLEQQPVYDAMILRELVPENDWVMDVFYSESERGYFETMKCVRKLSEGKRFVMFKREDVIKHGDFPDVKWPCP